MKRKPIDIAKQNIPSGRLITRRSFVYYSTAFASVFAGSLVAGCSRGETSSAQNDATSSSTAMIDGSDGVSPSASQPASRMRPAPNEHIARLAFISDLHVAADFPAAVSHARSAFAALATFEPAPDAIIVNGDITDDGQPEEYDLLVQLAAEAQLQFPRDFVPAMGNHEQRGYLHESTPEAFQAQRSLFLQRCGLDRLYYDTEVNGIHIIVLGPDADPASWKTTRVSEEQLHWLDMQLLNDKLIGRPSFVVFHQPVNDTVLYTYKGELAHGVFESGDQVKAVLSKYNDIVVVTAHSHSPNSFFQEEGGPLYVADSAVAYMRTDSHTSWKDSDANYSRGLITDAFGDRVEFISWDFVLQDEADTGRYTLSRFS